MRTLRPGQSTSTESTCHPSLECETGWAKADSDHAPARPIRSTGRLEVHGSSRVKSVSKLVLGTVIVLVVASIDAGVLIGRWRK